MLRKISLSEGYHRTGTHSFKAGSFEDAVWLRCIWPDAVLATLLPGAERLGNLQRYLPVNSSAISMILTWFWYKEKYRWIQGMYNYLHPLRIQHVKVPPFYRTLNTGQVFLPFYGRMETFPSIFGPYCRAYIWLVPEFAPRNILLVMDTR